jgi:hypothetical protein
MFLEEIAQDLQFYPAFRYQAAMFPIGYETLYAGTQFSIVVTHGIHADLQWRCVPD